MTPLDAKFYEGKLVLRIKATRIAFPQANVSINVDPQGGFSIPKHVMDDILKLFGMSPEQKKKDQRLCRMCGRYVGMHFKHKPTDESQRCQGSRKQSCDCATPTPNFT